MDSSYPTCRVVALVDSAGMIRHIEVACARRETPWRRIWRLRAQLSGRLAEWFRSLGREPAEITLLGSGTRLTREAARGAARLLADWFGCVPIPKGQPVGRRDSDGTTTTWPSHTAAAKALVVCPARVY
jgi:hypothetical protein